MPVRLPFGWLLAYCPAPEGMRMLRRAWITSLALLLASCTPTSQELVKQYNDDGVLLFERGNYAAARQSFGAAQKLAPDDVAVLYNLGQCHDRLGEPAKAEPLYKECLIRSPNHAACRHSLAVLWVKAGRQPQAERMIEDWLAREPKLSSPYAEDGWLWHLRNDLPRAQARLQQALQIDAHDMRALTELALVYEEMQRPDRALVLYERILDINPRQPEVARHVEQLKAQGAKPPKPE
jgi:Flp pilus assembly protein TadD